MDCNDPGASTLRLPLRSGFWRSLLNTTEVRSCFNEVCGERSLAGLLACTKIRKSARALFFTFFAVFLFPPLQFWVLFVGLYILRDLNGEGLYRVFSVRSGLARLGSARLGSVRFGLVRIFLETIFCPLCCFFSFTLISVSFHLSFLIFAPHDS